MSVGRICRREVDLADLDESVQAATERMHQHTVGVLVILNDAKHPIGIVTDRSEIRGKPKTGGGTSWKK